MGQYIRGRCVRPREEARGEYGNHIPKAMMDNVVIVSGPLAQLCKKEILFVRMTGMMSGCPMITMSLSIRLCKSAIATFPSERASIEQYFIWTLTFHSL